ncbi:hypothetical protein N865_14520 [Intrasporangium oryzae NRRL B-24470]|uniref:DSBA-like thioredoxin domain-containing protein n=1 Tax=Intrasporangium oryzae NRRL B-24470 TaxID=1386089 RepID=W9G3B5_9MICO|nr:DsbA family protein [Intrasporangium oryzae]EWT00596.1 hypothetical protein N865_14520 [Intrasporangium oryzae NRRL B-24470]
MSRTRLTIWGDFTCPFSYLAWRRSEDLAADADVEVDWRAVEHDPWHHLRPVDVTDRFTALHDEMPRVTAHLMPGEPLPYTLKGHVPFTGAATAGYAEAYGAGVAVPVRRALFDGFWRHGIDLDDARVIRTLLADDIRSGSSPTELLRVWGYAVDVTGGPITTMGWHLRRDWWSQWHELGGVVPTLVVDDGPASVGEDALTRLAAEMRARGLDEWDDPTREHSQHPAA